MQQKIIVHYVVGAVIGLLIGFVIWNTGVSRNSMMNSNQGMHMMPNGTMMNNNGMDMDDMMRSMNAGLQGKTGDDFDRVFLSEMIVHHQGAIDMAKLALTKAKHQEIKDLATAIITAQTNEINEMKGWLKSWFNL